MKKLIKRVFSSRTNTAVFVLAVILLLGVSISGAKAASRVQMNDIGVTLMENGEDISWRDYDQDGTWDERNGVLLQNMLGEGEKFCVGKRYSECLNVRNSGSINQYVRVTIYKYWADPNKVVDPKKEGDSNKLLELDPGLIDLSLCNLGSCWILDESSSSAERVVLYYNRLLPTGEETPLFMDALTISGEISEEYIDNQFWVEARVDVVQEHNAQDAIEKSWGQNVNIDEESGTLSLR